MLPPLLTGFERSESLHALRDYVSRHSSPDRSPSSSASALKFHEATALLVDAYSRECAGALDITEDDFAYIRGMDYLGRPRQHREANLMMNADLDDRGD